MKNKNLWNIWIDTGGTFTDCIGFDLKGEVHQIKILSSSALRGKIHKKISSDSFQVDFAIDIPSDFIKGYVFIILNKKHPQVTVKSYDTRNAIVKLSTPLPISVNPQDSFEVVSSEEAPIVGARLITKTTPDNTLPPLQMRLATTRGTNALLERKGTPTALFITEGFGDLLRIRNQQRPHLFELNIRTHQPLYDAVIEVPQRMDARGNIIKDMDLSQLSQQVYQLKKKNIYHAAVAFLHSYLNSEHEKQIAGYLLDQGFKHVSCSSQIAPIIKIVPRAETAVVNAYLSQVIELYLQQVQASISRGRVYTMTSAGGLVLSSAYQPKDSLLSGPAGGVVGAALSGKKSGFKKVIAFDMGGTSTDVSRFEGDYDYVFEHRVGDAYLVAPALSIETVAAGGGSICSYSGLEFKVGPESAGASPGPACYGEGGPLTLTDVNLLLGRLRADRFEIPINKKAAKVEFEKVCDKIKQSAKVIVRKEKILMGFLDIACERMADAINRISIRKGYDPTEYALVAFGGAGGQHACSVAEKLGIKTIIIPPDAGLLSAVGLGLAVMERFSELQILKLIDDIYRELPIIIRQEIKKVRSLLKKEGISEEEIIIRRIIINMRFQGQDSSISINWDRKSDLKKVFKKRYRSIFGHWPQSRSLEVESIRVVGSSRQVQKRTQIIKCGFHKSQTKEFQQSYIGGKWQQIPVFERSDLQCGAEIRGPALIFDRHSMTVMEKEWKAYIDQNQTLILKRCRKNSLRFEKNKPEVVELELFTHRFENLVAEMGEMLRRTALSTNVKERLDFSCALLDQQGELIVNAPHIPVHLGSMGICVRELRKIISMKKGDVIITNHPKFGGSHLPDITVVTPVFTSEKQLIGYVASRAHHAEIGGIRPGSMPPQAQNLWEEGVVISPIHFFKAGKSRIDKVKKFLSEGKYPSRTVDENLADLNAAVAANRKGAEILTDLTRKYGYDRINHYMNTLKKRAEQKIRSALRNVPNGDYTAEETLDDGSLIRVVFRIYDDSAVIDFTGSADVHPGNLNATPAIVLSSVIYVLRLLVNEPLPLNEGLMKTIILELPPGMLNPPFPDDPRQAPAIVGGNVETSQRIVDTLLKPLQLVAASQGTMNNVLFGNDNFSYYETVCGGCGAGRDFDGATAVHSHMTNTRITDPEIIEFRYPVRIEKFAVRPHSGGRGKHRGGDGVEREILFLEQMSLSVLGQHRKEGPYGIAGGHPGKPASQYLIRKSGKRKSLKSIDGIEVNSGDRFILKTPGGGGYGAPES